LANRLDFAVRLSQNLEGNNGSFFYSPFSIQSALAMTMLGAEGKTKAELHENIFGGRIYHVCKFRNK
jgi:serine protease inhibitor